MPSPSGRNSIVTVVGAPSMIHSQRKQARRIDVEHRRVDRCRSSGLASNLNRCPTSGTKSLGMSHTASAAESVIARHTVVGRVRVAHFVDDAVAVDHVSRLQVLAEPLQTVRPRTRRVARSQRSMSCKRSRRSA